MPIEPGPSFRFFDDEVGERGVDAVDNTDAFADAVMDREMFDLRIDQAAQLNERKSSVRNALVTDDVPVFDDELAADIFGGADIGAVVVLIDQRTGQCHRIAVDGRDLQGLSHARRPTAVEMIARQRVVGHNLQPGSRRKVVQGRLA